MKKKTSAPKIKEEKNTKPSSGILDPKYISVIIALFVLLFGNNLYAQITGHSLFSYPTPLTTSTVNFIVTAPVVTITASVTETPVPSATATFTPTPIVEINDGNAVMRFVSGGIFIMGSNFHDANEAKAHVVNVDSFYIDKFEVTNEMYKECVEKESCAPPTDRIYFLNAGYRNYPVVFVNWDMAVNYCKWRGARLPTEAEWEKAARGTTERIYPWGNQYFGKMANFCDEECSYSWANSLYDDGYISLSPVGFYLDGESFYGISDMAGNVWEWVSSLYKDYPYSYLDGREDMSLLGNRVKRGGSWGSSLYHLRTTVRRFEYPTYTNNLLGFRCAKDAQ